MGTPIKLTDETGIVRFEGTSSGGGSMPFKLLALPFAWDDADLFTGHALYTPTPGEYLYDAWIDVVTLWDGTTPQADIGLFTQNPIPAGLFLTYGVGAVDLTTQEFVDTTGLTISAKTLIAGLSGGYQRGKFTTTDPLCICITQSGAAGTVLAQTRSVNNTTGLLPITVVAGVNDEFVFTDSGGMGAPETFTIPPGTYTTLAQCVAAWAAATGSGSGERFDTRAQVGFGNSFGINFANDDLAVAALLPGSADNGDTITAGGNDGSASFGFQSPQTFADGADLDPGSSQGDGILYLLLSTP